MDDIVNIGEARNNLSALVERAEQGEAIVIARRGKPVAQIVPCAARAKPAFGWGKNLIDDDERASTAAMSDEDWFTTDPEIVAVMKKKGTW